MAKKLGVAAKNTKALKAYVPKDMTGVFFGGKKEAFLDVRVVTHKSARSCLVNNQPLSVALKDVWFSKKQTIMNSISRDNFINNSIDAIHSHYSVMRNE